MYQPPKRDLRGQFTMYPMDDVFYGAGAVANLASVLEAYGVRRALLVTGTTLATKTGLVDRVVAAADGRIGAVFHETVMHVHRGSVLRAAEMARSLGADGVVTFGGGTPNDTGKAVLLALAEGITDHDGFDGSRVKFEYPATVEVPPIKGDCLPMVAVSTTLSAGECTYFTGVTDEVRQVKDLYLDKKMTAKALFLDPELTLETPDWLWLSSGMRAVDHCIESMCSTNAHPYTDALESRALAMLNRYLRECKADPEDLVARTQAHLASWMSISGLANVSLGLSHGIGHQLGARCNVAHGITSCVMMYPVMTWNKDHVGDRQTWVAELLGVDTAGMDGDAANAAGREAVLGLVKDLGLPHRLRDVGVPESAFPALAADALQDLIVATNPRPVTSVEDVVEVLRTAY
jgi:alcohol dehydrogenase class IV